MKLTTIAKQVLAQQNESVVTEAEYKKGDKLKVKLKNGKEFDITFDSYSSNKGMAYGKIDGDRKPFSLDAVINEAKDIMIKQIERALKGGDSIFKLPMATQKYYNKNKSDFQVNLSSEEYQKMKKLKAFKQDEWKWNGDTQLWTKKQK